MGFQHCEAEENLKDTHFLVTSLVTNIYVIDKKRTFIFDIKKLYFDFFFFTKNSPTLGWKYIWLSTKYSF